MQLTHALDPLFNPTAVAVVGASEVPGKAAERRTRSLLQGGFGGKVYLINPKRDTLFGMKSYPTMAAVDGPVDLAMVVIAGRFIPEAVREAAAKGAKGIVIITAGLGETGAQGKQIEAEIMAVADAHGMHIIGPNCSGMYSASGRINLLGIPQIQPGQLSILAQSGNIIDSLTHFARRRNRGFSRIISSGNAIGVRFHDYIDYLADDPQTKVIMLYLESIKHGDELVRACRRAGRRKPIVAIKVGRTSAGRRASASHTGALAADDRIVEAAFEQAGIIRVANIDEMFDVAEAFLDCPLPRGRRVAILSEGGGDNSVAADNAERWGLAVPLLSDECQRRIKPLLLAGMPAHNPIDYGGTAEENPSVISGCVGELMASDEIDMVYLTGFFGGFKEIIAPHVGALETETARMLVEQVQASGKPLALHTSFALEEYEALQVLKAGGIPVQVSSDRAAQILAALARQADNAQHRELSSLPAADPGQRAAAGRIIAAVRQEGRRNLLETEAREILAAYKFELPLAALATSAREAAGHAIRLGLPAAVKVVAAEIIHKSEAGGVALNLKSAAAVEKAVQQMGRRIGERLASKGITGFLVSPMAGAGVECIFGMFRDPAFGPVVMFGLGGIFVEVFRDVAFGVAPLTTDDIERMLVSIRGSAILKGVRNQAPADLSFARNLLARISILAVENPELAELDLNPVILHTAGGSIVDARVILTA